MNQRTKRSQARVTGVIAACFFVIIAILFSCLLAFALPQESRYSEVLLTAESLEAFPMQNPSYLLIDEQCMNTEHCFLILLGAFPSMNSHQRYLMTRTLVLTIDGEVQRNFFATLIEGNLYAEIPPLSEGLHLIQLEIQDKGKRLYRHAWVIRETEGVASPATQALPPTPLMSSP